MMTRFNRMAVSTVAIVRHADVPASIGLTIPLVIAVTMVTHQSLILGLAPTDTLMLLFGAYFMLIFDR